mmetsp:Transcript_87761/g.131609  ORF Transcript_87761/g.131609 Transcript_87761/m.131609 type:complete len:94 (-) Transcript_87761:1109-1390(-)
MIGPCCQASYSAAVGDVAAAAVVGTVGCHSAVAAAAAVAGDHSNYCHHAVVAAAAAAVAGSFGSAVADRNSCWTEVLSAAAEGLPQVVEAEAL